MEYLYVCHFSNGHIKVGRSIDPKSRIAAHTDRVACVGVELAEHHIVECLGHSAPAESALIERCVGLATKRNKYEWFEGLNYLDVCEWAEQFSVLQIAAPACIEGMPNWRIFITDLRDAGFIQQQIAITCGCAQTTISDLRANRIKQPNYELGEALIAMHKRHCRNAITTPAI